MVLRHASLVDGVGGEPRCLCLVDGDEESKIREALVWRSGKRRAGGAGHTFRHKDSGGAPSNRDVSSHDRCRCQETKM